MKNRIVIGGGAAGYFGAITKKSLYPDCKVTLLESSLKPLSKVRISGGGRCNVTHDCFDPHLLVKNYPRGSKELLGPFTRFGPKETWEWFSSRGVPLKVEKDGRVFPVSDSSQSIIDALQGEAKRVGVEIVLGTKVESVEKRGDLFVVKTKEGLFEAEEVLLATGSQPIGYQIAKSFGHTIIDPVPSLFTFNVPASPLLELSGASAAPVDLKLGKFVRSGPILLTHWGFSGPAVLALSAFAARYLNECGYQADLYIDWSKAEALPKKLYKALLLKAGLEKEPVSKGERERFHQVLHKDHYRIDGKSTHKEEFVTAGGVALKEVDFRTMESRLVNGLYFAGEVLDIDAITGGFNFQAAWTTGYISGSV